MGKTEDMADLDANDVKMRKRYEMDLYPHDSVRDVFYIVHNVMSTKRKTCRIYTLSKETASE